jgi:hypothetical protein
MFVVGLVHYWRASTPLVAMFPSVHPRQYLMQESANSIFMPIAKAIISCRAPFSSYENAMIR